MDVKDQRQLDVKGSTILSKLDFVRERFGAGAEQALRTFVTETAGNRQILAGSWYPFALYESALRHIAENYYDGDLTRLREVGEDSAHRALTGTYEVYGQMGLAHFLSRIGALHKRFYSRGDIQAEMGEDGHGCSVRMFGVPFFSEADLELAAGFYTGAAREFGLREVRCDFTIAGDEVGFQLKWE